MDDRFVKKAIEDKHSIQLTPEEKTLLNTVIDLMIPADDQFPPPSSLHLIDELLRHLRPSIASHINLMLNEQRLRNILSNLNHAADGNFCKRSQEEQKLLLNDLEYQDPVSFQALWTLVNHSYYAHLAINQPMRQIV
jgi:hypothetical protein